MYGADYVWILHEIIGLPWWHRNINDCECNRKQLQEVAENLLMVSSYNSILSDEISHSGLVCANSFFFSLSLNFFSFVFFFAFQPFKCSIYQRPSEFSLEYFIIILLYFVIIRLKSMFVPLSIIIHVEIFSRFYK